MNNLNFEKVNILCVGRRGKYTKTDCIKNKLLIEKNKYNNKNVYDL